MRHIIEAALMHCYDHGLQLEQVVLHTAQGAVPLRLPEDYRGWLTLSDWHVLLAFEKNGPQTGPEVARLAGYSYTGGFRRQLKRLCALGFLRKLERGYALAKAVDQLPAPGGQHL